MILVWDKRATLNKDPNQQARTWRASGLFFFV